MYAIPTSPFLFLWIDPFLHGEHFPFLLQYKHSDAFANRKYEELSYPKKSENVRPHSSSSIENATPFSGICPLASYKAVPSTGIKARRVEFSKMHTISQEKQGMLGFC